MTDRHEQGRAATPWNAIVVAGAVALATLHGCGGSGDTDAPPALALTAQDIALNNRGVALMGSFDYPGAREVFRTAVDRQPQWQEARVNLAIATLNRQLEGDEERALALVGEVLAAEPDNLRGHYVAGLLQLYKGASAVAAGHFERVLEGDPDDAYAAYYLGQCRGQDDADAAMTLYRRAIEADPYLRSAYYGAAQALRRLGRADEAREMLDMYSRFADNPRARLAEFKYTRMGDKGTTQTVDLPGAPLTAVAAGAPVFGGPATLARIEGDAAGMTVTTVDLQGDGIQDLFITGAGSDMKTVLFVGAEDELQPATTHPLAGVTGVVAAAWGDLDNDGLVDGYLCRDGANQLWRQASAGEWRDVTASSGTAGDGARCRDVALLDADHDGDLDILVASDAGGELFNNNLDGSFRQLAGHDGLALTGGPARQTLAADIDNDRDVDLVQLNASPPHVVLLNDRLWQYQPASGLDALRNLDIVALAAADLDADGDNDLLSVAANGSLSVWHRSPQGRWQPRPTDVRVAVDAHFQMAVAEFDGDGRPDLLLRDADGVRALALADDGSSRSLLDQAGEFGGVLALVESARRGPSVIGLHAARDAAELWRWPPGSGRGQFTALRFSGKEDKADSMRSNRSGIGTRVALRSGSLWTMADTFDRHSGPGQSLQPLALGMGNASVADYVALHWSDGVFQTELDLDAGSLHEITETQRQLSSCPVIFAWDGERYAFVSDVLGVGGLGFMTAPGEVATPRPWEYFLLPDGALAERNGTLDIKFTEPMEEIAYLDQARLHAYDLPAGWSMVLDERMATGAPAVTGRPLFFRDRDRVTPSAARDANGQDVLQQLVLRDNLAVDPGPLDRRFIGRTRAPHSVTLYFDTALDARAGEPVLVASGWVEYPYSQTVFAAWQAGERYLPPTLEAAGADGVFRVVHREFGYPAGMPRTMSLPLAALPPGTRALRLTSTLQLYWDELAVVYVDAAPDVTPQELELRAASVAHTGFARRIAHPQARPDYDYAQRSPLWDSRHLNGYYTAAGDALELVETLDDAFAIIGPGEEVHLSFVAPAPPAAGLRRFYVLETRGYAKDMDLYTRDGGTVAPLPRTPGVMDYVDPAQREALQRRYNTRFEAGQ